MSSPQKTVGLAADALAEISEIVMRITGVQLGAAQRSMVESRVRRRMLQLEIAELGEYRQYLEKNRTEETASLISLLTTHHTFFFREFNQFEFIASHALADIARRAKARGDKKIRIWSAACSRGQEVYSLAMFMNFHLPLVAPDVTFSILGTDVCTESVKIAQNGVYSRSEIKEVPLNYLSAHWARGTGEIAEYVKAKKSLKDFCEFKSANLADLPSVSSQKFDIIFCRNVFIYFTQDQIKKITNHLLKNLDPEGLLLLGVSESLNGLGMKVASRGPSIYSFPKEEPVAKVIDLSTRAKTSVETKAPAEAKVSTETKAPLRVMCVDDSPSIHSLLKQILRKEQGFEIVATATNGLEAAKKLKEQPVDVITLDIHMPEQNGLEYLKKNFGSSHPPVVMLTSVSREDSQLAVDAFNLGATDYVEKPSLSTLSERGDEIRMKLRCAHRNRGLQTDRSLDREFQKQAQIVSPEKKARVILASFSERQKLKALFDELKGDQPPTYVLIEGGESGLGAFAKVFQTDVGHRYSVACSEAPRTGKTGAIDLLDFKKQFDAVCTALAGKEIVTLVYGEPSPALVKKVQGQKLGTMLLEDLGASSVQSGLSKVAADILPATSFAYVSSDHFGKTGK